MDKREFVRHLQSTGNAIMAVDPSLLTIIRRRVGGDELAAVTEQVAFAALGVVDDYGRKNNIPGGGKEMLLLATLTVALASSYHALASSLGEESSVADQVDGLLRSLGLRLTKKDGEE